MIVPPLSEATNSPIEALAMSGGLDMAWVLAFVTEPPTIPRFSIVPPVTSPKSPRRVVVPCGTLPVARIVRFEIVLPRPSNVPPKVATGERL